MLTGCVRLSQAEWQTVPAQFLHTMGGGAIALPRSALKTKECKHWLKGGCNKGESCGFMHSGEAGQGREIRFEESRSRSASRDRDRERRDRHRSAGRTPGPKRERGDSRSRDDKPDGGKGGRSRSRSKNP